MPKVIEKEEKNIQKKNFLLFFAYRGTLPATPPYGSHMLNKRIYSAFSQRFQLHLMVSEIILFFFSSQTICLNCK